jgi:hypothetical protein
MCKNILQAFTRSQNKTHLFYNIKKFLYYLFFNIFIAVMGLEPIKLYLAIKF